MNNQTNTVKKAVQGASLLVVTSFIAKILSAMYRVPYQNFVGDQGFFVYQQIYPIYGIAMMLALNGFPLFISKMVAETDKEEDVSLILQMIFFFLSALSVGMFLLVFFGAATIARLMGQELLAPLVQVSAFTFLFVPFLSIFRGGFQGKLEMAPTGISQMVEQFLRVGIIWLAAFLFAQHNLDIYQTGKLAMSGSLLGGVVAIGILLYYAKKTNTIPAFMGVGFLKKRHLSSKKILRRMLLEGGTLSIYSGFLVLLQLVDSFTVKDALMTYGLSELAAETQKGIYDRAQPIVQLALVIAFSLTSGFLPILTKAFISRDKKQFEKEVALYKKLSFLFAAAATVGLIGILPWMNQTLFQNNQLQGTISVFLIGIFFMILIQTYQGIDQSQGRHKLSLIAAVVGFSIKLLTNYRLTAHFGTIGASISTVLSLAVVLVIFVVFGKEFKLDVKFTLKVVLGLLAMTSVLVLFRQFLPPITHRPVTLLISILISVIGAGVFFFVLLKTNAFTDEELEEVPILNKFRTIIWK
ncbi:MAG: polysaccharide biosynthesis protein [Streptococcaceae bacterium]|jgi:PST family polysaccharide transporter|nr:polysaccharide biosynthesis protein [Streptococcaceae bacterium]